MINRDDMLELTRRMTPSRNCFSRVAGAYMDEEGFDNGTFNIHFGKLGATETKQKLDMAKTVIFSETNESLKDYKFGSNKKESLWPLLMTLKANGLKDDAMLATLYEIIGENYRAAGEYCIFLFYGSYDVPVKAKDKSWLEGSEEVYDFIICAIAPLEGEYEPGEPEFGFLFPAFADRSSDINNIYIYQAYGKPEQPALVKVIAG
ncbi:MAG: DUF4317 family protein [Lachnospiraceae bacterium]|nr:DUF4317 family protein [Lachnospiraceae bacterium]